MSRYEWALVNPWITEGVMLGKMEGKRRKGRQKMRWLGSMADSMDTNLSKLWEVAKDKGAWRATVQGVHRVGWPQRLDNNKPGSAWNGRRAGPPRALGVLSRPWEPCGPPLRLSAFPPFLSAYRVLASFVFLLITLDSGTFAPSKLCSTGLLPFKVSHVQIHPWGWDWQDQQCPPGRAD